MAIQYYMRAYNTNLSRYVDWIVNDTPDTTGTFSGYSTSDLSNIIVNRVVSSKIENFLKSNQSLGGFDGYYFHVNSYDWIKAVGPISPPTTPTGFAVERGITSSNTVIAASNTNPIVIQTGSAHSFSTGAYVTITGVLGNSAANGTFPITVISTSQFSLNGSQGNGTYVGGGNIYLPNNFSTITWHEPTNQWRFVANTNGDGVTLGASQNVRLLNNFVDGYASVGTTAHGTTTQAQTGAIRLPNNQFMVGRNAAGNLDVSLIGVDNLNRIRIGSVTTDLTYMPGSLIVDGYVAHTSTNVATTGFVREQNNTTIVAFRDSGNVNNIAALSSNNTNNVILGDAVNAGTIFNTATNGQHTFQVNSVGFLELGSAQTGAGTPFNNSAFARFSQAAASPVIGQTALTVGSGASFTVQAQATSASAQTGGILRLASGRGSGAGGFDGSVDIYTGTPGGGGTLKMSVHPTTAPTAANNNSIQLFQNRFRFDVAQTSPRVLQDDVTTTSTNGQTLTIQAQNATGTTSVGGNLVLTAGTGTTANGNVIIQTGGANQIIISPTQTTILGNLLVGGTTTSISSTVVELADRVIHVNSSANQFPGTTVPAPTQITGFSVDRGSSNNTTKRDYYGMFWVETDSTWKLAANTDGYTTETALSTTLPIITSYHMVQPNAAVTASAIPTVGGYRTLNNTTAVSSRNAIGNADLILLGTDSTNHIVHGAGTNNAGHIFNTTAGTSYDFQVGSALAYTITPVSAGTTVLQAAQTVTALTYSHATTASATGAVTTIQAQNAGTTGGNLVLTTGTGATNPGNLVFQVGGVSKLTLFNTATTPNTLQWLDTTTAPIINQAGTSTASATGAAFTIHAQNATGTTSTGGNLVLGSGNGTTTAGNVLFQVGGTTTASAVPNKFAFNRGWRRNVTAVTTTYQVVASDDLVAVTALASAYTITLPATPTTGDCYTIKDTTGQAATFNVTVSGNGVNIDGLATFKLVQPYAAAVFTYTGSQWSVT